MTTYIYPVFMALLALSGPLLALWVRRDCRRRLDQALNLHRRLYHPGQAPTPARRP